MELNREKIVIEIEGLVKALKFNKGWWENRGRGGWFNHDILEDALALINELAVENEYLKSTDIGELQQEYDSLAKSLEDAIELIDKIRAKKAKLSEENERLKNRLLIADEDIKRLRNRVTANIILTAEDAEKIKTECLEKIQLDVKAIKADTVRKMQEKLRDGHLTATNPNVICLYESELDQIAKELMGVD